MINYYINLETGVITTEKDMLIDLKENYDIDDPTNALDWTEYYEFYMRSKPLW